jgi:hypothetical protein
MELPQHGCGAFIARGNTSKSPHRWHHMSNLTHWSRTPDDNKNLRNYQIWKTIVVFVSRLQIQALAKLHSVPW